VHLSSEGDSDQGDYNNASTRPRCTESSTKEEIKSTVTRIGELSGAGNTIRCTKISNILFKCVETRNTRDGGGECEGGRANLEGGPYRRYIEDMYEPGR